MPLAEELGLTLSQLALAWCLKNPNVSSIITGASQPEHVSENMKAIETKDKLTPNIMTQIEKILGNKPKPDEDFR